MDAELRRYLNAVFGLLCLIVGFQATELWVSSVGMSLTFFVVPVAIAAVVALTVGTLAELLEN